MNEDEKWLRSLPPKRGAYDWADIVRALHRRPDQWLLIGEQIPRSVCSAIKRDHIAALRNPRWNYQCRSRRTSADLKLADIYMMASRRTEEESSAPTS